jgi:hypothetical protein
MVPIEIGELTAAVNRVRAIKPRSSIAHLVQSGFLVSALLS